MSKLNSLSLVKLTQLYTMRQNRALKKLQIQIAKVRESESELATREKKVSDMKQEISDTANYASKPEISSHPKRLIEVESYCRWINYDLEREMYYLNLTKDELEGHLLELEKTRLDLAKAQFRIKILNERKNTFRVTNEVISERMSEDEFESKLGIRG